MTKDSIVVYRYPNNYRALGLKEQIQGIVKFSSDCGIRCNTQSSMQLAERLESIPISDGMEEYFAVLNLQKLSYEEMMKKLFEAWEKQHGSKIETRQREELGVQYLRQTERSLCAWNEISEQQDHSDILIIQAQLGFKYLSYSVSEVLDGIKERLDPLPETDFGLGAFHAGIIALIHPNRFGGDIYNPSSDNEKLIYCPGMSCPGDEYNFKNNNFGDIPYWWFNNKMLFGSIKKTEDCRYWAPVTGRKVEL